MNSQQQPNGPEERIEAALDELRRASRQLAAAPRRVLDGLNQNLRRMRTFDSESQWSSIILDACAPFASRVAVFSVNVDALKFQAARGAIGAPDGEIALKDARAFQAAVETAEPVIAVRTSGEMSGTLVGLFGEDPSSRFGVFPIVAGTKVAGLVYAETAEMSAIDLVTTLAGAVLEAHRAGASEFEKASKAGMIRIEPAAAAPDRATEATLGGEEHELADLKARRFARSGVAAILLDHANALEAGRTRRDIYGALKESIDKAREEYRRRYLNDAPIHADYLHSELVKTLGRNDEALLGPDYPGSLA